MAEESQITPQQPQTDKALDVKDPSSVDDVITFNYDPATNFTVKDYVTFIQDANDVNNPSMFPGGSDTYAPTSSPFIIQINGNGFNASSLSNAPFKVYAQIGNFIAVIPPLPTSTDLKAGNAYGYVVKSTTIIWVYFSRLLFQKIWFQPVTKSFDGEESVYKNQIESGDGAYQFLSGVPPLKIFFAANVGNFLFKPNFFDANNFKSVSVTLEQSPFIITLQGAKKGGAVFPSIIPDGETVRRAVSLFGHKIDVGVGGNQRKVLLVKTSSSLLKLNPSALPQNVLSADQSTSAIQNMNFQDVSNLEFFKEGNFLTGLRTEAASQTSAYDFFDANGFIVNSGPKGHLPPDNLPTVKFDITILPAGNYFVVVYDQETGAYSVAPNTITFSSQINAMQIHDVSPSTVVLQNPTFTVNGFNFPTIDDLNNGATLTIALVQSNLLSVFSSTAILQINKDSTNNDINNNGTITLNSTSQITAKFTNLHITLKANDNNVAFLKISVTYAKEDIPKGKINDIETSQPIIIKSSPVIHFLTNTESNPPDNSKSLVRIDQSTGQVIANGVPTKNLYVVGENLGDKASASVLIKGNAQKVIDVKPWIPNLSLSAIIVEVSPGTMKGDATVEVKVNDLSSEPFVIEPQPSINIPTTNIIINSQGRFVKQDETVPIAFFESLIPYNRFDAKFTLLNNQNTKIASSIAVKLMNLESKEQVSLSGKLGLDNATSISFLPNVIVIGANTPLTKNGTLDIIFNFFNIYNVNLSTPKIFRIQHEDGNFQNPTFEPNEIMTIIGTGFVDGMRYNINDVGWQSVKGLFPIIVDTSTYQAFKITVPPSNGTATAKVQVSNEQAQSVSSINAAGKQNGPFKVDTIVVNDKYSPLLQINQRLPAGIKMYAKGPQVSMTDKIDANMSIFGQLSPFLSGFKTLLIVIRIIVCIIDVICALINPFKLIIAIIALMDCIIDLLSLFPQLAVPIMILSFLQNFVGFIKTLVAQIVSYVFSIVNTQLALVNAQLTKDFASLAAAEQQSFAVTKQIKDATAFLEPPLSIIQIFKDLLAFAMHIPCAGNQGGSQADGTCPPENIQQMIQEMVADRTVPPNSYTVEPGHLVRSNGIVTVQTIKTNKLSVDSHFTLMPGEIDFVSGTKTVAKIIDDHSFTYIESGHNATSIFTETIGTIVSNEQQATLATMFCQAIALQQATLQTMPGIPVPPGSTAVLPVLTPVLPDVAATIECMNNLTNNIENALNAGKIFITTPEQGEALVNSYTQCLQNLLDQTNQAIGDTCVLAVSALNSELKVSPKGSVGKDLSDDFIRTKIALPTTNPNDIQDAGLTLDLAKITTPLDVPQTITTDPKSKSESNSLNFGLQQDINTPVIVQTTNKSGQRQSINTIYFNSDNNLVGDLIVPGDILEIVGGTFNGLQFPILAVQKIFTAVRLTVKLDITAEQKLLVGEQKIPGDLAGFDVKVIAHLAGNDAVAVVPADNQSLATIQIIARDHHGHEIGPSLASKIAIKIESGDAEFVPVIPSDITDVTGVIQEQGDHYITNLKADCAGTVIVSASVCGIQFVDIGYHANDINHVIQTRLKTIKIIFTPPIPKPIPGAFVTLERPQIPGTHFDN